MIDEEETVGGPGEDDADAQDSENTEELEHDPDDEEPEEDVLNEDGDDAEGDEDEEGDEPGAEGDDGLPPTGGVEVPIKPETAQKRRYRERKRKREKLATKKKSLITREFYESIRQGFLIYPGNFTAVARHVGIDQRTVKRAWERGWCDLNSKPRLDWARPIQECFAEEWAAARRKMAEDAALRRQMDASQYRGAMRKAFEKAQEDLAESRALQGRTVRTARTNALALNSIIARQIQAAAKLGERIREALEDPGWRPKPREAMYLMKQITWMTREAAEASKIADEMERKALGEVDVIISHETRMSLDEAIAEIEESKNALERARARGTLTIVPTGSEG